MRRLIFYILLFTTPIAFAQGSCVDITVDSIQDAECNSPTSYTGSTSISVTNGSGNYNYDWQDLSGNSLFPPQTTATAVNLPPGSYIVEVSDVTNSCMETEQITIGHMGLIDADAVYTAFTSNPVFYNQWTFDTVKVYSYGCETRVRPEFRISHATAYVSTTDFLIEYYDVFANQWTSLTAFNDNGTVVGYFGDTTGTVLNQPVISQTLRVKFLASADTGMYTSENELWQVDTNGTHIQKLDSLDVVPLELANACPTFSAVSTVTNSSCFGFSDGSINLQVSGGNPPYTFTWSNGATTEDLFSLAPDTYYVDIQDAGVCVILDTFIVQNANNIHPTNLFTDNITAESVSLHFDSLSTADYYRFKYRPVGASSWIWAGLGNPDTILVIDSVKNIVNLQSNTLYEWQIKVWDMNGCIGGWSSSQFFTTACVDVEFNVQNPVCYNDSNGVISTTLTGTGVYSFLWSTGDLTSSVSNLAEGSYSLTITDTSGCFIVDSVNLINPLPISTNLPANVYVCGNDTVISPGQNFQSYLWSTGDTSSSLFVQTEGVYFVSAIDQDGCATTDTSNVYIINAHPNQYTYSICDGDTATITITGGGANYFFWSPIGAYGDTLKVSPISNTTYQLTMYGANHQCYAFVSVNVFPSTSVSLTSTNVGCYGGADGTASATASGGVLPYSYLWEDGQTTPAVQGLSVGYYAVEVSDSNNCSAIDSIFVSGPPPITLQHTYDEPSCFGYSDGEIFVTASAGVSPYVYNWSNGTQSSLLDSVPSGNYSLNVTDANGCGQSGSFTLSQPDSLTVSSIDSLLQNVLCYGGSSGQGTMTIQGGTPQYLYYLNGQFQLTNTFSNLEEGTYDVLVQDAQGCQDSTSFVITQPLDTLILQEDLLLHENVSCYGFSDGAFTLSASGGTGVYTYAIGGAYQFDSTFSNLLEGSYLAQVVDENLCSDTVTIYVSSPDSISFSDTVLMPSCFSYSDGDIQVSASGGTTPYSFSWEDGSVGFSLDSVSEGLYTVYVLDANSCLDSTELYVPEPDALLVIENTLLHQDASCNSYEDGQLQVLASGGTPSFVFNLLGDTISNATGYFNSLGAGLHHFQVLDQNSCADTIIIEVLEPDSVQIQIAALTNVSCYGGSDASVDLVASGGTPTYMYSVNQGAYQLSNQFHALVAGVYSFQIQDDNSCLSDTIEVILTQPSSPLSVNEDMSQHMDITCFGENNGAFSLDVQGGVTPYSISINAIPFLSILVHDSLSSGQYNVTVTDSNNCLAYDTVFIVQPNQLSAFSVYANPSCYGVNDASINVNPYGGVSPYHILWNTIDSVFSLQGLEPSNYSFTLTDANQCVYQDSIFLLSPDSMLITASVSNASCFGNPNGGISLVVSGGASSSYQYSLDNANFQTLPQFGGLSAGNYSVYVQDANSCLDSVEVIVTQPDSLYLQLDSALLHLSCYGLSSGFVDYSVLGGTLPYIITLNGANPSSIPYYNNLTAGGYFIQVQDANACYASDMFYVSQPDSMIVSLSETNASCYGINDGELLANVTSGGTSPYTYSIDNNLFYPVGAFMSLSAGIDTLIVQDSSGCQQSYVFEITQPDSLSITVAAQEPSCFGECDGVVQATVFGGNNYTLLWSNFSSELVNDSLCDGLISLTVTDSLGCSNYYSYDLQQPPPVYPIVVQNGNVLSTDSSYVSYQWSSQAGPINDADSIHFIPSESGMYWVEVTDSNGCTGASLGYDFIFTSVSEEGALLKVYPNPTREFLIVENDQQSSWTISDIQGKELLNGAFLKRKKIDVSALKQGVYTLQIFTEKNRYTRKIVKQ